MNNKRKIYKIAFFIILLVIAFFGIYWYTSPNRCSSSYEGEIRSLFSSDSEYNMCTNYYGMSIFKNKNKALLKARGDYSSAVVTLRAIYSLNTIDDGNYEEYLGYALKFDIQDEALENQVKILASFLDIYGNSLKRAKPYLECVFTKTFYVIDTLENYETGNDYIYVILKNPTTSEPMMIKLGEEYKNVFVEGKYFEVSFINDKKYTGSYSNYIDLFENLIIKKIAESKREESNQLQENGCR